MDKKVWYKSITVWFNVALIVIGAITQLAEFIPIPPQVLVYVGMLGNLLLRLKTNTGLGLRNYE